MTEDAWRFDEGQEIWPGRRALAPLGRSSRYETWLALDERLLAIVVVKLIRPHRIDEEHVRRDLAHEADILFGLAHPIVVRAFDAVVDGPRPHIVMEHLEGPTLRALLRRHGSVSMEQLLPLALHICSALHYLTQEEVVHLDVKPENIVMAAPPRLIDFSIARPVKDAQQLHDPIGTYAYMSPEQAVTERNFEISPATDVWGLGMSLYEAATGHSPFDGIDDDVTPEKLPQLWQEPAYIPQDVPAHLIEILISCLERDPALRPSANEIAVQLEPLVAALPRYPTLRRRRPGM